jgi:hypothetical protein
MSYRKVLLSLAALAALAVPRIAGAQTACNTLTPSPIYISGSTALEPLIKVLGRYTATDTVNGHTLVYLKDGSCSGVARLGADELIKQTMNYIPATYTDPTQPVPTCTVDATAGVKGSLVLSDVDPKLCPVATTLTSVTDFPGPVNDMVLVVPKDQTTYKALSAEMLYLIFGLGDMSQVMPWINPLYYFIRTPDSGTRAMIAANIGIGAHDWKGVSKDPTTMKAFGSGDVFNMVSAQTGATVDQTLGILGQDFYDTGNNRASVHALAFRAFHQRYAYWPDSTLTARDRKNVREGRYSIWGNVHILAKTTAGAPSYPEADYFVKLLTGTLTPSPLTGVDIDDAVTDAHLTPVCAMKVKHDIEGGAMTPFSPDKPCGCSFEARATGNQTPPGCTACSATSPCATGTCRKGFCEAK